MSRKRSAGLTLAELIFGFFFLAIVSALIGAATWPYRAPRQPSQTTIQTGTGAESTGEIIVETVELGSGLTFSGASPKVVQAAVETWVRAHADYSVPTVIPVPLTGEGNGLKALTFIASRKK